MKYERIITRDNNIINSGSSSSSSKSVEGQRSGKSGDDRYWQIDTHFTTADGDIFVESFWYDSVQRRIVAYQGGTPDDPKASQTDGSAYTVNGNFDQDAEIMTELKGLVFKYTFHSDGRLSVVMSGTVSTTASGTWKLVTKTASYP
jgi:hypothetical protein